MIEIEKLYELTRESLKRDRETIKEKNKELSDLIDRYRNVCSENSKLRKEVDRLTHIINDIQDIVNGDTIN